MTIAASAVNKQFMNTLSGEAHIAALSEYFRGFYIETAAGNNAFSFEDRKNKKIFVPEIIEGDVSDLKVGKEIAFSEIIRGKEINCSGLRQFVYRHRGGKRIFIFDNHNHAFFFWAYAIKQGWLRMGGNLVHVDQHKDTRDPDQFCDTLDLNTAFYYAQNEINVGNFISPALRLNIFAEIIQVLNPLDFEKDIPAPFTLDIDLDIFSSEMDYIPKELKIQKIRSYMEKTDLITIATSPFFMDQNEAIKILAELF